MTTISSGARSGVLPVNGTDIHYDVRGHGPGLLCISGAFGDAGYWTAVGGLLADRFTVAAYDRRGNSRSSPTNAATTMAEQADDAAELIERLGLAPAVVLGSSGGAVILLDLVARHPQVVRLALVHEPPLLAVLPDGAEIGTELRTLTERAVAGGGPRAAAEMFIRMNAGDETFETLDAQLRERMLGNAERFLTGEIEAFTTYQPDVAALRSSSVPMVALTGVDSRDAYYDRAARWVADQVGCPIVEVPGAHVPYFTCPDAFAAAIRPLL